MKKYFVKEGLLIVTYPLISSLLLVLAYNTSYFFLIFFSFIPSIIALEHCALLDKKYRKQFLGSILIMLMIWNLFTAGWILKINVLACILVVFFNSLFFTAPFYLYLLKRQKYHIVIPCAFFTLIWISIEYLHTLSALGFPYLTLGYTLAEFPQFIQWYAFGGVHYGSALILLSNFLLAGFWVKSFRLKPVTYFVLSAFLTITLGATFFFRKDYSDHKKVSVLSLHPDTDCYTYKYNISQDSLVNNYLEILSKGSYSADLIIAPETAITGPVNYDGLDSSSAILKIKKWLKNHSNTTIITGAIVTRNIKINRFLVNPDTIPHLQYDKMYWRYFYSYNAALSFDQFSHVSIYTKMKLVPFEETIPYPGILIPFEGLVKSLGGFHFTTLHDQNDYLQTRTARVVPVICYESVFGGFIADRMKSGGEIICVMLNEGWYNNLTAAKQFLKFSVVRALENRRSVIRSSNKGISCFIDPDGSVSQLYSTFNPQTIKGVLPLNSEQTFYTVYHGFIDSSFLIFLAILIVVQKRGKIR